MPGTYTVSHTDQFGSHGAIVVKHPLRVADPPSFPPFNGPLTLEPGILGYAWMTATPISSTLSSGLNSSVTPNNPIAG